VENGASTLFFPWGDGGGKGGGVSVRQPRKRMARFSAESSIPQQLDRLMDTKKSRNKEKRGRILPCPPKPGRMSHNNKIIYQRERKRKKRRGDGTKEEGQLLCKMGVVCLNQSRKPAVGLYLYWGQKCSNGRHNSKGNRRVQLPRTGRGVGGRKRR